MDKFNSISRVSITSNQPYINITYKSKHEIDENMKQKILLATIDYVMKDSRIDDLIHGKFKTNGKPDVRIGFLGPQRTTFYEGNYNDKNYRNEIDNYDIWDISKREEDIFTDYLSIINIPKLLNMNDIQKENKFIYKFRNLRRFNRSVFIIKSNANENSMLIDEDSVKKKILYELEHMVTLIEVEKNNIDDYLYMYVFERPHEKLFIYHTLNDQYIKFGNRIFKIYEGRINLDRFTKSF